MSNRTTTIESNGRYMDFLLEIHARCKDDYADPIDLFRGTIKNGTAQSLTKEYSISNSCRKSMTDLGILKKKGGIRDDKNHLKWGLDRKPTMEDVRRIKDLNNQNVQKTRQKNAAKTQSLPEETSSQEVSNVKEVISEAAMNNLPETVVAQTDSEILHNINNGIRTLLEEVRSVREEIKGQSSMVSKVWANMDTVLTAMQGRFEEFIASK